VGVNDGDSDFFAVGGKGGFSKGILLSVVVLLVNDMVCNLLGTLGGNGGFLRGILLSSVAVLENDRVCILLGGKNAVLKEALLLVDLVTDKFKIFLLIKKHTFLFVYDPLLFYSTSRLSSIPLPYQ
jgi:hypothetical protein